MLLDSVLAEIPFYRAGGHLVDAAEVARVAAQQETALVGLAHLVNSLSWLGRKTIKRVKSNWSRDFAVRPGSQTGSGCAVFVVER
jgi:hypothetical protein